MKIQVELAPYSHSVKKDIDAWYILTVMFPLLDNVDIKELIYTLQDNLIEFHIWNKKYSSVRIHWYDLNQPIRIAYPENSYPIIILVLQVYCNDVTNIHNKDLFINY